jgi:Na+/melibiose symporter-like transporter
MSPDRYGTMDVDTKTRTVIINSSSDNNDYATKQQQLGPSSTSSLLQPYEKLQSQQQHPQSQSSLLHIDDAIEMLGMGTFQYQILLAAGLCFMADAMEVLLLSFLATILKYEWDLTERQTDTIISVVFAGALLGTLILSPLGDVWGRRPVFAVTAGLIAIFGIATAFCTNYAQLLTTRFLVVRH